MDSEAKLYDALEFNKGFGPGMEINPYLKLLPMMAGIGSPGTLGDVSIIILFSATTRSDMLYWTVD